MDKILVSACLMGEKVRYDGNHNALNHPLLQRWQDQGRLIRICPESAGGLPTPRPPAEAQSQFPIHITSRQGDDLTPEFLQGAELTLELAKANQVCCALMKAKSPSCGNNEIYDGNFSGTLTKGSGVAAAELIRSGIPVFNETQIDQLIEFVNDMDTNLKDGTFTSDD
ncbi:DUF523 domain-containing protein [Marinobacterium jannaschii]|uniref:DUF523 domain-containing protein n=1 Tax=Marinobacterium jannaschii TaxID=64970 RepID=UPI0004862215|nr:DUF523 domain-containing protein [Marinobacterium jannaschii]